MIDNKFEQIINIPLSVYLIKRLIEISETVGILRGAIQQSDFSELFYNMLHIKELVYLNVINGNDYNLKQILCGVYGNDTENEIDSQHKIIEICGIFATEKTKRYKILPASDFIRINECIRNHNIELLSDVSFTEKIESGNKMIYELLSFIYANYDGTPAILNIIAVYLTLRSQRIKYNIETEALNILLTTLFNPNEKSPKIMIYTAKLRLLESVIIQADKTDEIECQVINFLEYLRNEFERNSLLVKKLSAEISMTQKRLIEEVPKICSSELFHLFKNILCFRYGELVEDLKITYKTAVQYAKVLESKGFIESEKIGRDKIFINSGLLSLMRRETEFDGA